VSLNDRVSASLNQVTAHPYAVIAGELIRFRVDANDDLIAGVVRAVIAEGEAGCEAFRQGLGIEEADTVRLFAMRRVLHGRRQSSLGPLYEALDGFALLPSLDDVPWNSWLKAALFVARTLGGNFDMISNRFGDVANDDAAQRYDVAMESMNRVDELSQCRLAEVQTNYGIGFVEILVFRDTKTRSFYAPATLGSNQIQYDPTTNLAQLAVSLADALDDTGSVVTGPICQDQLAASFFSMTTPGSYVPTTGCLSFVTDEVSGRGSFTALVAELPDDTDDDDDDDDDDYTDDDPETDTHSETLVQGAIDTDQQVAACDGRRLIVLSPQPSFNEDVDEDIDVRVFVEFVHNALADPAAR
jgi:hypothetical protein